MQFRLIARERVDSTSERAFSALARGEARDGDVFWALEQTSGRGRRGASWHSARGEGLYMSVVLLPAPPPLHPAALTMAAGLAVHRALAALGLAEVALKWPNDVVVGDAKLAGILVETRGLDPQRPHYVVGIGVNVRQREFPPELAAQRPVTSLALLGLELEIEQVRDALLEQLPELLEGARPPAAELAAEFLAATRLQHRRVEVETQAGRREGVLRGLTVERGLDLEGAGGSRQEIALEHVRQLRAPS